jgi:parvulin-like peptidyl-prolyl isomerase
VALAAGQASGAAAPPTGASQAARPTTKAGPTAAPEKAAQPAQIMAVVNGEQITRTALAKECLLRRGNDVLDTLVNKHIIYQACRARGITITDQEVNDEINSIAAKFKLPVDRWLALLESERNVDANQYRRDIIWPMLALRRLAAKEVTVSQQEYQQAFDADYGPKVKARLIAVGTRQKAEKILALAQANPDNFPRLAKEHSEDKASASAYGVIPPICKHLSDPNLEQAAFALKEGAISPIVQVGNQYLILHCEKQIPRIYIAADQLPDIEKRLKERIKDHKLRVQSTEVFQQLQAQTKIVKVFNDPKLQAQYPETAAIINDRQITLAQLSEECLARHGKSVLDGEVNRALLTQELRRKGQEVRQQDIDAEVSRAADAYGYVKADGQPDVDRWLKTVTENDNTTVSLYLRDTVWPSMALKKLVGDTIQVTDEDLKKGFEANFGERVEVLAIVMSNQRQAQTVWEMARNSPTDQFFGEQAHLYSVEPTSQANYGRVPPIRMHGGQPVLEKEAFRLKAGELSGILAIGDKYVILRCLGRTQPVVKEFDAVKGELTKDIHEKKLRVAMAKEFDRLKESAQIDNFLAGTTQSGKASDPTTKPAATQASFIQPAKRPQPPMKR